MMHEKSFTKLMNDNHENAVFCGVISGLAKYYGINVTLARWFFFLGAFFVAPFIFLILYFSLSFVMPKYEPEHDLQNFDDDNEDDDDKEISLKIKEFENDNLS